MYRNSARFKNSNRVFHKYDSYDIPKRLDAIRQNCNRIIELEQESKFLHHRTRNLAQRSETTVAGNNAQRSEQKLLAPSSLNTMFLFDTDDDSSEEGDNQFCSLPSLPSEEEPRLESFTKLLWNRTFQVWKNSLLSGIRRKVLRNRRSCQIHDLETVERCQAEQVKLGTSTVLECIYNDIDLDIDKKKQGIEQEEDAKAWAELDPETQEIISSLVPVKFTVSGSGEVNRYIVKTKGGDYLDVTEIGMEHKNDLVDRFLARRQEFKSMVLNEHCASLVWIFNENTRIVLLTESTEPDSWSPQQYYRFVLSSLALADSIMIGHPYYWHPTVRRKLSRAVKQFKKLYKSIDDKREHAKLIEERRKLREEVVEIVHNFRQNYNENIMSKTESQHDLAVSSSASISTVATSLTKQDSSDCIEVKNGQTRVILRTSRETGPAIESLEKLVTEVYEKWKPSEDNLSNGFIKDGSVASVHPIQETDLANPEEVSEFLEEVHADQVDHQQQNKKKRFKLVRIDSNITKIVGEESSSEEGDLDDFDENNNRRRRRRDDSSPDDKRPPTLKRARQPYIDQFKEYILNLDSNSNNPTNKDDLGSVLEDEETRLIQEFGRPGFSIKHHRKNYRPQKRATPQQSKYRKSRSANEMTSTNSQGAASPNQSTAVMEERQDSRPLSRIEEDNPLPSSGAGSVRVESQQSEPTLTQQQQQRSGFRFPRLGISKYQPAMRTTETSSMPSLEAAIIIGPPVVTFNEPLLIPPAQAGVDVPIGDHFHRHHQEFLGHNFDMPPADADRTSPIKMKSLSDEDLSSMVTQLDLETSTYPENLSIFSHYGVQHDPAHHHGEPPRCLSNLHGSTVRSNLARTEHSSLKPLDLSPRGVIQPNASGVHHYRPLGTSTGSSQNPASNTGDNNEKRKNP